MVKTRRDRSVSFDSSRRSPLPRSLSRAKHSSSSSSVEIEEDVKEWEELRCPVCMEHPHNAVLLICASYEKGCRPYMCDTSYRHSNCFDQFCKSIVETPPPSEVLSPPSEVPSPPSEVPSPPSEVPSPSQEATLHTPSPIIFTEPSVNESDEERNRSPVSENNLPDMRKLHQKLLCPLCRGRVLGCTVVESARNFMNDKLRNCACETCEFNGNYTDLRKHARQNHPLVRPSEVDPERQRNWRRLERQRDIGDVLSTIQASFGEDNQDGATILPIEDSNLLTVIFFIRVFNSGGSSRSSSRSGTSRGQAQAQIDDRGRSSVRLWGESYDDETTSIPRVFNPPETTADVPTRRSRRRSRVVEDDDEEQTDGASRDVDQDSTGAASGGRSRRIRRRTTRYEPQ